ncbi:hypothetical protein [Methyloversatilis sp. XJ19-49]|uniref:hypothetical protein n=1 Tax=Methyloversatilis sp. XJ19-49 TaxID=2963429 RepID=UPI00211C951C|nr:hypothetical protein [Methyloversatilis sp. XJ19-49]MCQ9376539.1 hypothetical protein [Methyloversatilis sp. XJ19-49]
MNARDAGFLRDIRGRRKPLHPLTCGRRKKWRARSVQAMQALHSHAVDFPETTMKALPLAALLALAFSTAAHAQPAPSDRMETRIDNRQDRQETRTDRGIANGTVTAHEAARLEHQQAHIDRVENRALADGAIDRKEAVRMERMQDRANASIRHQKHDPQMRR